MIDEVKTINARKPLFAGDRVEAAACGQPA